MKQMKQITSFALCFIMAALFSVTPNMTLAADPISVTAKDSATVVKGVQGHFTEDGVFEATTNAEVDTEFTATISSTDGKNTELIKATAKAVKPETVTASTQNELKFTFTAEELKKLPASTTAYDVKVTYKTGETIPSTSTTEATTATSTTEATTATSTTEATTATSTTEVTTPTTTEVEKTTTIGTVSFVNQPYVRTTDFNTLSPSDVNITVADYGLELTAVKNGATTLVENTDYTVSSDKTTVTIKKEYLSKQEKSTTLSFVFKNAAEATTTINFYAHNPKKTVKLVGYKSAAVTTVTLNEGDKLPTWSKAKYKAAGRKGYEMTGWTYDGKTVTTVPESVSDTITLTASFKKMSVGKAKKLTLTGHAGAGCGFDATSKIYTKADGSRRGFRFRYSSYSSMKSSTYKTTGLAKNKYTKTGLSKGKKRYVQVRYYYYDSTNAKVYGAYSTAKSVKTY